MLLSEHIEATRHHGERETADQNSRLMDLHSRKGKGRAANGNRPLGAASCRREQQIQGDMPTPPPPTVTAESVYGGDIQSIVTDPSNGKQWPVRAAQEHLHDPFFSCSEADLMATVPAMEVANGMARVGTQVQVQGPNGAWKKGIVASLRTGKRLQIQYDDGTSQTAASQTIFRQKPQSAPSSTGEPQALPPQAIAIANGPAQVGTLVQTADGGQGVVVQLAPGKLEVRQDDGSRVWVPASKLHRQAPLPVPVSSSGPSLTLGPVIGLVTDRTARILFELKAAADVTMTLQSSEGDRVVTRPVPPARPAVFAFEDLAPSTLYTVQIGNIPHVTSAFRTRPRCLALSDAPVFGIVACNKLSITRDAVAPQGDVWQVCLVLGPSPVCGVFLVGPLQCMRWPASANGTADRQTPTTEVDDSEGWGIEHGVTRAHTHTHTGLMQDVVGMQALYIVLLSC